MLLLAWITVAALTKAFAQSRTMRGAVDTPQHRRESPGISKRSVPITPDEIPGISLKTSNKVYGDDLTDIVITNTMSVPAPGTLIVAADGNTTLYDWVAQQIQDSSDANSCKLWYGTVFNGEIWGGYTYQTTATAGSDCGLTASYDAIRNAVGSCADKLYALRTVRGCCRLTYGDTWTAQLRLTAESDGWPAADC